MDNKEIKNKTKQQQKQQQIASYKLFDNVTDFLSRFKNLI